MSRVSSKTMTTPDPSGKPEARKSSNVIFTSKCSDVANAPAAPPNKTDFKLFPFATPPAISINSRNVTPNGTSYKPGWVTSPETQNNFGPGDFSVPIFLYSATPFEIIKGTLHSVSTLLITVGLLNKPCVVGKGGFTRGKPRFPSIDSNSAVSSPQM